jgi:hypothetical protein
MWFTATFDRPGLWTFRTFSEQATRAARTRPLGVRLYRAPSGQRVTDPSVLTFVQGTDGSLINGYAGYPGYPGPVWSSALVDVPVEAGRYYWSVDEGADGPTYYSLSSTYRAVAAPPPSGVVFQSTNAGAIGEGGLHQVRIERTGDLSAAATVTFAIRGGTATTDDIGLVRGTDHVNGGFATLGTGFGTYSLTFNPGANFVVLAVASAQDSVVEPDETFVLELLSATGATLGDPSLRVATGTILNDDVLPPSCAADLSGILSVTKGPIRYVWMRQRFEQAVSLTNTTNTTIPAPVHVALALDGLGAHVTMVNASGVTSCATPAGSPYIVFPDSSNIPWGPGVKVTIVNLAFTTTQNLPITYTTRVLGGTSR